MMQHHLDYKYLLKVILCNFCLHKKYFQNIYRVLERLNLFILLL